MVSFSGALAALFVALPSTMASGGGEGYISTDSKAGRSLLKKALVVTKTDEHGQILETGERVLQEGDNWYLNGGTYIKYLGCSDFEGYGQDGWKNEAYQGQNNGQQQQWQNGQNQEMQGGDNGYYNYQQYEEQMNQQQEQAQGNYYNQNGAGYAYGQNNVNYENYRQNYNAQNDNQVMTHLVRFTLCQSKGCYRCNGEYAVDMEDFVNAYTELYMSAEEYQCEQVRENCFCYNAYREQCNYECYQQAGMPECMEYYGQEQFKVQEYLQCSEMDYYPANYAAQQQNANNAANGGGYGGQYQYRQQGGQNRAQGYQGYRYWVGPYCANNREIYLGAFYDQNCINPAAKSVFQSKNYGGATFPYFFEPMIKSGECISCMDTDRYYENQQKYNKQQYNYQVQNQMYANYANYQQNVANNNYQYGNNRAGGQNWYYYQQGQNGAQNGQNYYQNQQAQGDGGQNQQQYGYNQDSAAAYNNANQQWRDGNWNMNGENGEYDMYRQYAYEQQEQMRQEGEYGDANQFCQAAVGDSISCDYNMGMTGGCNYLNNVLPSLDGRKSLTGMYSNMYNRITRSKRAAIVFGSLTLLFLGAIAVMCGFLMTSPSHRKPKHENFLESRRTDDSMMA